ncbi:anthranilate phosphoribosyltransferase [Salinicoccus sesuvii]|uniref:Anthranilate phosphoribosyltransferase n=1 Tax=Salinicoccus sesuvii TaxID=868281 RepID=A0ABV7N9L1_9STAP
MKPYLAKLSERADLKFEEMQDAVSILLTESVTDSEVAAFLMGLKAKGETVDEIAALVEVLRTHAMPIHRYLEGVMDNCGTGGDGSNSFNISTTSAFVLAGAGVKVAKHGNRSVTSRTGSSDVLSEVGVSLSFNPEDIDLLLDTNGIAFLFAPHAHPKIKQVMKVRNDLKVPTIFNLIGPLINPVKLDYQFLGVYKADKVEMMAHVLKRLGRKRAVVINGAGSMDEASLLGENHMTLLDNGRITNMTFTPESVGLPRYAIEEITGGDSRENAEILTNVLSGEATPAQRDTVLLNAGIGLFSAGVAETIREGIEKARESIDSGRALSKLNHLIDYTQKGGI